MEAATLPTVDSVGCVPDVRGLGLRESLSLLEAAGFTVTATGHGKVVAQKPAPGTASADGSVELTLSTDKKSDK